MEKYKSSKYVKTQMHTVSEKFYLTMSNNHYFQHYLHDVKVATKMISCLILYQSPSLNSTFLLPSEVKKNFKLKLEESLTTVTGNFLVVVGDWVHLGAWNQGLEGYSRDPGFDQNTMRDSGKRKIS